MRRGSPPGWGLRLGALVVCAGSIPPVLAEPERPTEPLVRAAVEPVTGNPYRFVLRLEAKPGIDLVADRRLLELSFRPQGSRRSYRCRHPSRPRRPDPSRVQESVTDPWVEWFDLRMYCWSSRGRLAEGGTLEGSYGFRRRGARRWVARDPEREVHRVDVPALAFGSISREAAAPSGTVQPSMSDVDVATGEGVTFRLRLRGEPQASGTSPRRVYLRDDLVSFAVYGAGRDAQCAVTPDDVVPIVDFFRVIDDRRTARTTIAARRWCTPGTFSRAGIYEVTPLVDLVYDGVRYGIPAVTGRFVGGRALVRVRREGAGYVEQLLEQLEVEGEEP